MAQYAPVHNVDNRLNEEGDALANPDNLQKGDVVTFSVTVELATGPHLADDYLEMDSLTLEAVAGDIQALLHGKSHRLLSITAARSLVLGEYQDLS